MNAQKTQNNLPTFSIISIFLYFKIIYFHIFLRSTYIVILLPLHLIALLLLHSCGSCEFRAAPRKVPANFATQ